VIRALVTGARGQVGAELARALAGRAEVAAHDRATLDLADRDQLVRRLREERPALILNAAAYTAVDRAEGEPQVARAVNAVAPGVIAEEAKRLGALLVHFSTDYVFDGTKPVPYVESDEPSPVSTYGRTKLEGEEAIARAGCDHLVLRTSWVYGPRGQNFLLTMLKLAATRPEIRVVDDQHGAPTSSRQLARAVIEVLLGNDAEREITAADIDRLRERSGVYHATARGETTWFGFAQAIFAEHARTPGRAFTAPRVVAIPTSEYPTPARRPANSRLSNDKLERAFGVKLGPWRDGLREVLSALPR
jgi:dTDP-4-dehydrorhamnose reductase